MGTLGEKKLFLLDMDGTLYLGDSLFPGVTDFLRHVKERGGRALFLTNNSSRGVEQYREKMNRLGIATEVEDYFTSVDATILFLQERYGAGAKQMKIYGAGTESFRRQLRKAGFQVTDEREPGVELLLSGFDTELTFQKLEDACILLKEGVDWIATNPDWVCPTWYGFVPDCGSVCEMLSRATGRKPEFVGKPEPLMARAAMKKAGYDAGQTLMIGDRIYTDIACGVNAGVDTALVLSGETDEQTAAASSIRPTWIFRDIQQLLEAMRGEEAARQEVIF